MAEDIRNGHSEVRVTGRRAEELVKECERQEESCQYTAAGLYIWQKRARMWRNCFVVAPIVLGGLASSQILGALQQAWATWAGAVLALLAGFFPAIYVSLGMDMRGERDWAISRRIHQPSRPLPAGGEGQELSSGRGV